MAVTVIIGLGLSGLSFYDSLEGKEDTICVDKSTELGGYTRTIKISDFKFDYTGHFLHLKEYKSPASIGSKGIYYKDQWTHVNKKSSVFIDEKFCQAPYQYNFGQLGFNHTI